MPPFDKATMDGYACRRADLGNPLTVIETIPAGRMAGEGGWAESVCQDHDGGRHVPQGADCVVMIEQTQSRWPRMRFRFTGAQTPDNIFRKATDIQAGQMVLQKGGRISPPHIAVLASVGHVQPLVAKRPQGGRYRQRRRTGRADGTTGTGPDQELQRFSTDRSACGAWVWTLATTAL